MTTATLTEVQRLVDQLTPLEQAQLMEYLTPRLVRALVELPLPQANDLQRALPSEWQTLFALGDSLPDAEHELSLTQAVMEMRR
ncbi:MAG: hypothetical protein KDD89_10035 [Anaerolineales bacterium]|nr:hypothetical protein [Anaerolineales bacterium]